MIIYSYQCDLCGQLTDKRFKMGKAPSSIKCFCGSRAFRVYSISIKVPHPTSEARSGRGRGYGR